MGKNIHIIICSDLDIANGGCETWLSYFLPELSSRHMYKKIYVYHVNHTGSEVNLQKNGIVYISRSNKNNGIYNVLLFTSFVIKNISRMAECYDDILLIGSTFVAPVGIFCNFFIKKSLCINTWIRSIAVKELKIRSPRIAFLAQFMEKILLNCSNKVILNGRDTYDYYKKIFPIANKAVIIENAVPNEELFDIPLKTDFKKIKIAYMGRYCKAKGFDKYVESVRQYDVADSSLEFHAYGYGDLEQSLKNTDINNHGRFKNTDVNNILKSVDVVVFLNRTGIAGGLSHSLLECMAAGKIIIAWDNNIHNQICDDRNAFMVKDDSLNDLISSYKSLNNNSIKNKVFNAREKAKQYTIKKHVDKFLKFIKDI